MNSMNNILTALGTKSFSDTDTDSRFSLVEVTSRARRR